MTTTASPAPKTLTGDSTTALPRACVCLANGTSGAASGYQHLVALARLMGRQAAAEIIRAGAMPASLSPLENPK
jgi:hypothetical protein